MSQSAKVVAMLFVIFNNYEHSNIYFAVPLFYVKRSSFSCGFHALLLFSPCVAHRFQTRQLEWAKVEDSRLASMVEDRGLDEDGKLFVQVFPVLYWCAT